MINQNKITTAKVTQRLSGNIDIPRPPVTPKNLMGDTLTQWRTCEIDYTDDFGKVFLTEHHLKKALRNVNCYIRDFIPKDPRISFKTMSENFLENLDFRTLPAMKGLGYFTIPPGTPAIRYQEICSEYEKKVQVVKEKNAHGKGRFKNGCNQLSPHFKKLLNDLKKFLEDVLIDYFGYIPDQNLGW